MTRKFHEHVAGGFSFHIFRCYCSANKWKARVRPHSTYRGGWPNVRSVDGRHVMESSVKRMKIYLNYAYAGKVGL